MADSGPMKGYSADTAIVAIGPVKTLPEELARDLRMRLVSRISKKWLRDAASFVPQPYLPMPSSELLAEKWLLAIARHRGYAKRAGIVAACNAPSFKALVRYYWNHREIPGMAVAAPGTQFWLFELEVERESTGQPFNLPCFTVKLGENEERSDGMPLANRDGLALTAAGLNWQVFLWHAEHARQHWAARAAAWPYYNAAILSAVMALEAHINAEAERHIKQDRPHDAEIRELTEADGPIALARKIETWPQKWGAKALAHGTPLHRDVMWLLDLRNEMVHPKQSWVALRDNDKNNLSRAKEVVTEVIRYWNFSIPAALPVWLTTECSVNFDPPEPSNAKSNELAK